jgi:hypothetical protein
LAGAKQPRSARSNLAPEWYPISRRVYLGLEPGPRLR